MKGLEPEPYLFITNIGYLEEKQYLVHRPTELKPTEMFRQNLTDRKKHGIAHIVSTSAKKVLNARWYTQFGNYMESLISTHEAEKPSAKTIKIL